MGFMVCFFFHPLHYTLFDEWTQDFFVIAEDYGVYDLEAGLQITDYRFRFSANGKKFKSWEKGLIFCLSFFPFVVPP